MAYNLVVNFSNFKPYDFNETFQVLKEIQADKQRREEQLNKIYEEMGKYNLPEGSKYGDQQKQFWSDLDAAAENFYDSRGSVASKRAIKDLWRRYSRDMVPIKNMVEGYNKGQEILTKLGPDAIIGNKDALNNVETYYGGVTPKVDYRSASTIQATAAKTMQGINNALMQSPELAGSIANQYFKIKEAGLNGQEALTTILQHNPQLGTQEGVQDTSQLLQALDSLYSQFAFKDGAPENAKVWESIRSGAIAGIQAPKYNMQVDHSYESDYQEAQRKYTQMQTEYYQDIKEEEISNKKLHQGWIPKTDPQTGEIMRDNSGKIMYEFNLDEASARLKALNAKDDNDTPKPTKLPAKAQLLEVDGIQYAIEETTENKADIFYRLSDDGVSWEKIPLTDEGLITKLRSAFSIAKRQSQRSRNALPGQPAQWGEVPNYGTPQGTDKSSKDKYEEQNR